MNPLINTIIASSSLMTGVSPELAWTPTEILKTELISDVQVSPKNDAILFVSTKPLVKEDQPINFSSIYHAKLDGSAKATLFITTDNSSTQPRWSPNGEWVAFLSNQGGKKNLYLVPAEGGSPVPLTQEGSDVQTFIWSPDSRQIAFVMSDETELAKNQKNGSGAYVLGDVLKVNRLWLIDAKSPPSQPKPITHDQYSVRGVGDYGTINAEYDWSPDGKTIIFAYSHSIGSDDFHLYSQLATIDLASGHITPWKQEAFYEALPRYSPDGSHVAYVLNNYKAMYSDNRRMAIRSKDGQNFKILAPTPNEGPFLAGPTLLGWTKDAKSLLYFEPKGTKYHIALVPTDGSPTQELSTGDWFFKEPSLSRDRTALGFVAQNTSTPPEAYAAAVESFKPVKGSDLNKNSLSLPKIRTEVISWHAQDGQKIEGLLSYPTDYKDGEKYPLVLVIHGGPSGFFDETFIGTVYPYPMASFANAGYFVFRPNPRGSTGYGLDFRIANYNDWGGKDYQDIMSGVDYVVEKGMADPDRLGVMGWSYGGYMTAWVITQTNRFKAASMGAGLSNLASMTGTTDVYRMLTDYLGDFNTNQKLYNERSPVYYALNVTTPCLIQHGIEDKRVPVSQGYEFYHALNRADKKPVFVLYPGMEHRFSDPKMQLDLMERNFIWFHEHLKK